MGSRTVRVQAGALVVAAGLALLTPDPIAAGDPVSDQSQSLDQQIAALKDDLEGSSADLVQAAVALARLQPQLAGARQAQAAAQAARAAAVAKDQEVGAQLAFAQAQLDKAEQEIEVEQSAAASTRNALGEIAREAYIGSRFSGLSIALQASSPEQFTERLAIAGVALRAQGGAIDRLAVQQAEVRARMVKLDAVRARIAALKRQSALVVTQRLASERAAAAAAAQVSTLVSAQATQVARIRSKIAGEKQRLNALQAEQAKLQAVLAARAGAAARQRHGGDWTPPASGGFLSYPAVGPITSGFGMRYHPILHYSRMHTGVDFGIDCGTPVHAAADGEIVSAGPAGGYGNRVVIDHGEVRGGDLATTYNHLSQIVVFSGRVQRGQLIAYSGTTGLSTGCHLHFETLLDGEFVNPMGYL